MVRPDRSQARMLAVMPLALAAFALAPLRAPAMGQVARAAQSRGIPVPDLMRLDSAAAIRALLELKLVPSPQSRAVFDGNLVGRVVDQSPPPATRVQPGSQVSFTIARDGRITMPDVIARPFEEAAAMLREAGLLARPAVDTTRGDGPPTGRVAQQDPIAGARIPPRTRAQLTIARSEVALVSVPDVVGRPQRTAVDVLMDAHLTPMTRMIAVFNRDSAGRVLEQQPAAGARLRPGAAVSLLVGRDARIVTPSVAGRTFADARQRLRDAGLTGPVGTQRDSGRGEPTDQVVRQSPAAGTRVTATTPVLLTLGRAAIAVTPVVPLGPVGTATAAPQTQAPPRTSTALEEVVVPSVIGLPVDSARTILARSALVLGVDRSGLLARFPRGRVHAQSPDAGTIVVRGAMITVVPRHLLGIIGVMALLAGAAGLAALAAAHAAWPPPSVSVAARPAPELAPHIAGSADHLVALQVSLRSRVRTYSPRLHVNGPLVRS